MTRIGVRFKLGATLTVAVLAAAVVTVLLVSGSSNAASPTASNRALAGREAGLLLSAVRLPGGVSATTSGSEAGRGTAITDLGPATGPDTAQRAGSWTVPESEAAVRAFLTAHPPSGTRPSPQSALTFVAIGPRRGLAAASIELSVLATGPRTTVVRAEALVRWLVARSSAERVPAGARELEITRGPEGRKPTLVVHVTAPARIARIRALLNRLPLVQPGRVYHCPAQFPQVPVVTFLFRAGGKSTRVLAGASEEADVRSPTTACDAMRFVLDGRVGTPLLGGYRVLRQVSALLGVRLWTPPYAA